jgi:hypothetical protein
MMSAFSNFPSLTPKRAVALVATMPPGSRQNPRRRRRSLHDHGTRFHQGNV